MVYWQGHGVVRRVRYTGYLFEFDLKQVEAPLLERGQPSTQLEGGSGLNQLHGTGGEVAQLIDDPAEAVDRQTGVGLLTSGFSAGGRRAPGGVDGRGSLCFWGLGIVVVEEDRGVSPHAVLTPVSDRADLEVDGLEAAEGVLDSR